MCNVAFERYRSKMLLCQNDSLKSSFGLKITPFEVTTTTTIHVNHWNLGIVNRRLNEKGVNKQTEDLGLNPHLEQVFFSVSIMPF